MIDKCNPFHHYAPVIVEDVFISDTIVAEQWRESMNKLSCPLPFIDIGQCTRSITSCFRSLFMRAGFPPKNLHRVTTTCIGTIICSADTSSPIPCCGTLQYQIYMLDEFNTNNGFLRLDSKCPASRSRDAVDCVHLESSPGVVRPVSPPRCTYISTHA